MGSSSKDSRGGPGAASKKQQAGNQAGDPLTLQLAGLDPVLEAVDELPPSGSPIPPSAQSRVRQFLTQQLSTGTSAAVQALCVRPKDLQDTKQLHEALQRHANHLHSAVEGYHGVAMPAAAAQLVADAVRTVARQQVVEKNSTAYGLLLDEGYRAGIIAVGCAGLKSQLGLRIITTAQLARAIAVVVQAVARSVAVGASTGQLRPEVSISFAWERLKPYHSDSGSSSSSGSNGSCPWRPSHVDVLSRFVQVTEGCMDVMGSNLDDVLGPQLCNILTAALNPVKSDGPAASVAPNMPSSAAGSSSSSSGRRGPSAAAAAAGSMGGAPQSGGSNQGSAASNASAMPQLPANQIDLSLPLDDCPLLAAHCQLYGPVVAALAGWPSSSCQELPGGLRAAVKQCVVAQLAAFSGRQQAYGGGKRRTIVPSTFPRSVNSLSELQAAMTSMLQIQAQVSPGPQQVLSPLPQLLRAVVQEVAREQAVEKNSPAFDTLIQAGMNAGCVAAACAGLHIELGIRLTTGQQLFEALKASCLAVAAYKSHVVDEQSMARTAYHDLLRITAAADSGSGSGGSTSASGSSTGGSGSKGTASAVPKCGWDLAHNVVVYFACSQVYLTTCEGDMTEALAHAGSPWVLLETTFKGAFLSGGDCLMSSVLGLISQPGSGSGAAGSSSSTAAAAAQGQEAESWGKGQGLAGLKGLFASKPAAAGGAAAAPAAQPVTVKASSSSGKGAAAAPAAAAAAVGVNKAAAAAGTGSKGSAKQSDSCSPSSVGSLNSGRALLQATDRVIDMALPLDDCPLLAAHCQLFEPVVVAIASLAEFGPTEERCPTALGGPVLGAIMQCVAGKAAAGGGSSGQQAYGGGRRRSVVPNLPPADVHSLPELGKFMATMQLMLATVSTTLECVLAPLPDLVCVAVQEVARQQAVEEGTAAFDTLIQAALSAGAVAAGCAALQTELDIVLTSDQQLFEAVKASCVALAKAQKRLGPVSQDAVRQAVAFALYQDLLRITAAADSGSSGGSSSANGGSVSGSATSSSSSSGPPVAMPKCDLAVAYDVILYTSTSLASLRECEGEMTEAVARADSSWTVVREMLQSDVAAKMRAVLSQRPGALFSQPESGPGAAGSSSSSSTPAAAQGQEAGGRGKWQGLAGLKGLFASKPAAAAGGAAAAPAAQPVTVKASSSGAVVATSRGAKAAASAVAAAAAVVAKAAAAAPGGSATTSSSAAAAATSSSSSEATDPDLLVPANLKSWYCSPATFDLNDVGPLPQDSLQLLVKLQLHTTYRDHGWNALHYACASHRIDLVKQLLAAGASPSEPEDNALLQPLHLACMGEITLSDQFYDLLEECSHIETFKQYLFRSAYASSQLVALLLSHGACANAKAGLPGSELEGLTPLHILSCWHGEEGERDRKLVFNNPWVGKAFMANTSKMPMPPKVLLCQAKRDFDTFSVTGRTADPEGGGRSLQSPALVDFTTRLSAKQQVAVTSSSELTAEWDDDLDLAVQHVGAVRALLEAGASADVMVGPLWETPLMIAAQRGNAAVTAALLEGEADPEQLRADGARALEIAADKGYAVVGWTLLCYGAQALPDWAVSGKPEPWAQDPPAALTPAAHPSLTHQMLVCNAVQCQGHPWNCFFLQRLLADGAGLEDVWPDTGETPLLMAVTYLDEDMVCMLVAAGADVNVKVKPSCPHEGDTTIAALLFHTVKDKPSQHPAKQILQVLIDAGADLASYRNLETDYDHVQTAANRCDMDAALKLVEAGCKWQLPKGQRVLAGSIYYAPEILTTNIPNLKLAYVEGRFRLAEKVGRQKRAAIATALQPWLSPDVTPECKDATLRCLVAAGVTPGNPHTRQRPLLTSALSPRVKARWAGVQAQRAAAAAAAGGSAGQQGSGAQPGPRQGSAAVDDIDALLEEIESVGVKEPSARGAPAAAGSKGAAKKKKKETVAQRQARQKQLQLQRARQLQSGGSSSDSEGEGEGRGSRDAGGSLSAAGTAEAVADAAETQVGSGAAAAPEEQLSEQEAMAASTQQQTTQQQQQAQQKHENSQKGKAARKQQQQASSDAAAVPAGQAVAQSPVTEPPKQQPAVPLPAATAVPAIAAVKAATTGGVQQQVAGLPTAGGGTVQQLQQQGVALVPQGAPVTPPAAPAAMPTAAPQANPSPVAMRPAAFLPPHLRISMPAALAAGVVPGVGGAGAPMQVPPVLPMPAQAVPQVVHPVAMQPPPPPPQQHQQQLQQQQLLQERQQGSALQQRMVELAKQYQLQQQAAQQGAAAPKQPQPQPSSSPGSHVPAVPRAMMDMLLSGSAQHTKAAAGRTGHAGHAAAAGSSSAARAAQQPSGAKRQPPAVAAHSVGQATVQAQQHGRTPTAGVKAAAGTAAGDQAGGGKGPKLCLVCAQRRRNVLLIPCRHLVLCAECAEQLHGRGQLTSCPHCKKPCKQRIQVHQS